VILQSGMVRGGLSLTEQSLAVPVFCGTALADRPLADKLRAVPENMARYLDYCAKLAGWLENLQGSWRLAALVRPQVERDPTKFFTLEEFDRQFSDDDAASLAGFVTLRAANVKQQVAELRR
jgi:spore coat protein H